MRIKHWFSAKDDTVVDLNYCIGDRIWFKILWTEDKWLDNKHLNAGTWWLRKKMRSHIITNHVWLYLTQYFRQCFIKKGARSQLMTHY
ncbi:hypothetical protein Sjap_011609 [Stephania japonica]|uniref:Uncharacterized protein n=1 Tax=Stephania japonica TaxID=461633 RepID=A0AAP0P4V1_9MAGN